MSVSARRQASAQMPSSSRACRGHWIRAPRSARLYRRRYLHPSDTPFRPSPENDRAHPHDGTLRLTTSGTTGDPKGVMLSASQIAWTADQVRLSHRLTPADRGWRCCHSSTSTRRSSASAQPYWRGMRRHRAAFQRSSFLGMGGARAYHLGQRRADHRSAALTTEKPRSCREHCASCVRPRRRCLLRVIALLRHALASPDRDLGLSEAASQVTANPLPPAQRKPARWVYRRASCCVFVSCRTSQPMASMETAMPATSASKARVTCPLG